MLLFRTLHVLKLIFRVVPDSKFISLREMLPPYVLQYLRVFSRLLFPCLLTASVEGGIKKSIHMGGIGR